MTTTTVNKQLMSDETVAALTLDVPSGSHDHSFDGGMAKTLIGGSHAHVFVLPNGEPLRTELSGEHYHDLYMCGGPNKIEFDGYGGRHAHSVVIGNGDRVMTEDEGCHWHHWESGGDRLPTGQHRHTLVLPSGLVLMSAMPGDKLYDLANEALRAADMINMTKAIGEPEGPDAYPPLEKRYDLDATASLVSKDGEISLAVGFEFSGRPVTLVLDIARKGVEVGSIDAAAESFGTHGSRYTVDLGAAELPAKLAKSNHVIVGKRLESAVIETLKVDCGYQSATVREFYLKGDKVRGRVVVETRGDNTVAKFTTDLTPYIVTNGDTAELPPFGNPGMPVWLAFACPHEYMYWQEPDRATAKAKLAGLSKAGFYSADSTAYVNGDARVIERETLLKLYTPGRGADGSAAVLFDTAERTVVDPVQRVKQLVRGTWGAASEPGVDATHYSIELGDGITKSDLEHVIARIAASDRAYLVELADTPMAREVCEPLGPMFKFKHAGAPASLFVASFDPSAGIAPIEFVRVSQADIVKRVEAGDLDPGYRRIIAKSVDGAEERVAYGVVLEPDGVDAQNDTISAETIRYAAHKFMESFQNMGLQHKQIVNDKVKLLESYITLCDMDVNGEAVKAGTWVMVVRYDDEELWNGVKSGRLTGFSIGGFAKRSPLQS